MLGQLQEGNNSCVAMLEHRSETRGEQLDSITKVKSHVVLVSLLVDQLSSLFLSFFGRPKKICSVSGNFWSGSDFFGQPNFFLVYQNFFLVYQKIRAWPKKIQRLTKNSLRLNKFFLVNQKKGEIDWTIGRPRDWPKSHGRDYYEVFRNLSNVRLKISIENSSTDDTDTMSGCVLVRHYSMEQSSWHSKIIKQRALGKIQR